MKALMFALVMSFLAGCGSSSLNPPEGVVADTTMRNIILEMALADAASAISAQSPELPRFKPELFYERILKQYGVSRDQLITSIQYYSSETATLSRIYEEALMEINRRQAEERR